jgi:DNA polymerase-3 subunit epsilon
MKNLNLTKPLVTFDLETTGLSTTDDKIIEISCVKIDKEGTRSTFYTLINPERSIDPEASKVHGYTKEMLSEYPTFKEVAPSLLKFIRGCYIGSFNGIRFDIPLLISEFNNVGIEWNPSFNDVIDVMNIYHKHEPRNLSSAYKFYTGKDMEGAHQAQNDVLAVIEIMEAQITKYDLSNNIDNLIEEYTPLKGYLDYSKKLRYNDRGNITLDFGKHKGYELADIYYRDKGYFSWMLNKSDFHINTKNALKTELNKLNIKY